MAPLAKLEHMQPKWPIQYLINHIRSVEKWANYFHVYDFFGVWEMEWGKLICGERDQLCLYLETWLWATTHHYEDPDRF
jgi:hypothetical protein